MGEPSPPRYCAHCRAIAYTSLVGMSDWLCKRCSIKIGSAWLGASGGVREHAPVAPEYGEWVLRRAADESFFLEDKCEWWNTVSLAAAAHRTASGPNSYRGCVPQITSSDVEARLAPLRRKVLMTDLVLGALVIVSILYVFVR